MYLSAPQWLLLLPVLALAGWRFPQLGFFRPLRAVCLILLVVLLCDPRWRAASRGMDLFVLVDRSASAEHSLGAVVDEWLALLEKSRGPDDRLRVVDFAGDAAERAEGTGLPGTKEESRLGFAVDVAAALANPQRAARLLVFTDGYATDDLNAAAARLRERGLSLDSRTLPALSGDTVRIEQMTGPQSASPGEPVVLEARVRAVDRESVDVRIRRDGAEIARVEVPVKNGLGILHFADVPPHGGIRHYEVEADGVGDKVPRNNSGTWMVNVISRGRALVLSAYVPGDPAAEVLRQKGWDVEMPEDFSRLHTGMLAGARLVIINNVPAYGLPEAFLKALDFYVKEQGGGLVMFGGSYAFGSGGYFQSPVDELLPVSMELRREHRKMAVALAIVLDRSGSMMAPASGGVTKMDLANEGAARSIELLGALDDVTVWAVDSMAHVVVPLSRVGQDPSPLTQAVRRIGSGGGGIFVYEGMQAAWNELKKSRAGQKHMILFADAADAEEPGEYVKLLEEMRAADATVSVIGMGTEKDQDAGLLKDIAAKGGGRMFFTADAVDIPAVFAQETVAVARSAFVKEATPTLDTGGWLEIAGRALDWPKEVGGYNLSYLRPGATQALKTADEEEAPLVAFWYRGAGRTAAVSFPIAGPFSQMQQMWPQKGDFLSTLLRWASGGEEPEGLQLRNRFEGNVLVMELRGGENWLERFASSPPRIVVAEGADGPARELIWERIGPSRYETRVEVTPGTYLRGVVDAAGERIAFGPLSPAVNAEWDFSPEKKAAFRALVSGSGGEEAGDLSRVWKMPRPVSEGSLRPPLLAVFLIVFLGEALATRVGWGIHAGRNSAGSSRMASVR